LVSNPHSATPQRMEFVQTQKQHDFSDICKTDLRLNTEENITLYIIHFRAFILIFEIKTN
jgi:hypothetical protein